MATNTISPCFHDPNTWRLVENVVHQDDLSHWIEGYGIYCDASGRQLYPAEAIIRVLEWQREL